MMIILVDLEAKLTASDSSADDSCGRSVAISGSTILVGVYIYSAACFHCGGQMEMLRRERQWRSTNPLEDDHSDGEDNRNSNSQKNA